MLAYDPNDHKKPSKDRNPIKREIFETNLTSQGLELEKEENQKIHFVKIHVPREVLCRYCEIMKMKMPIKKVKFDLKSEFKTINFIIYFII